MRRRINAAPKYIQKWFKKRKRWDEKSNDLEKIELQLSIFSDQFLIHIDDILQIKFLKI